MRRRNDRSIIISVRTTLIQLRDRLGPGLLFAAAAVGTSHLVQSTRAGAAYGLTLGILVVAICAIKYPLFRFAADYAAATGESLVAGYARRGRLLVWLMFAASAIEAVAAVAGVSLVTAGIAGWLFQLNTSDLTTTLSVLAVTAALVAVGRYRLLEITASLFVVLFSVLVLIVTIASLPALIGSTTSSFPPFEFTTSNLSFATAVAGWMPIGNTAAIMLAAWILAKRQDAPAQTLSRSRFDFNLGYLASSTLAVCFLIMGAAVLFARPVELPGGGAQFAATFVDMFEAIVGSWSGVLVAIAALAVMYSTLLAIVDGFPRMLQNFLGELGVRGSGGRGQFLLLLCLVVCAASAFLIFFLSAFTRFIDLVTIIGFVAAPIVAWANYLVITGDEVPEAARPGAGLILWSHAATGVLLVASLSFLYLRFSA